MTATGDRLLEICDPAVREMLDGWGVEPVREILRVSLYYPDDSTIPQAARGGCCCGCGVQLTAYMYVENRIAYLHVSAPRGAPDDGAMPDAALRWTTRDASRAIHEPER